MGLLCFIKCSLKCFVILVVFASALLFLPGLPPLHNMQFNAYDVPPTKKLEGPLALNSKLNNAERLFENMIKGPESIVSHEGVLYTGLHGGLVVKIVDNSLIPFLKFGKSCDGQHEEHICGRPLGLFIDSTKSLYVADAYYGLYKANLTTGEVVQLVSPDTEIEGRKPKLFNSVTVAADGKVYWTDSDSNVDLKNLMFSALADGTGRLIKYDPVTKSNSVLVDRLHFANGVALASDESYITVAESMRFRIYRHHLKGSKKGTTEVFVDGLPGLPDNLKADKQGNVYVNLVQARDENLTPSLLLNVGKYPLLRKLVAQSLGLLQTTFSTISNVCPHVIFKKIVHAVGHFETFSTFLPQIPRVTILKLNKDGKIVESWHAQDKRIEAISDVEFVGDYAYLGSPYNQYLARVKLTKN